MKSLFRIPGLVVFSVISLPAMAQESERSSVDEIEKLFQKGLFAEEVNEDLAEAKNAYREVLDLFAEQEKLAATATFRLAEVYRKLAATNSGGDYEDQAAREYANVIRRFPEMKVLVKLSRENLTAMGRALPDGPVPALADEEAKRIAELEEWFETSPDKLREEPTPLYLAAEQNQLRVAKYLIGKGVNPDQGAGDSPLSIAANAGHLAMVKLLLEAGASPNPEGSEPAIHSALRGNRFEVVKWLIEKGAHLNVANNVENSPLQILIRLPGQLRQLGRTDFTDEQVLAYAGMLIDAGADVDYINEESGMTALMIAIQERSPLLNQLLETADPKLAGKKHGATALHYAVIAKDLSLVKKLLSKGVDVNQADMVGYTPLHYAIDNKLSLEFVEALIEAGADVNQRIGENGWTSLHLWASEFGDDRIGRALYRAGANPIALAKKIPRDLDARSLDFDKHTPLHFLLDNRRHDVPIVREFFEHGLQTLPPRKFENGVWFLMPPGLNNDPEVGESTLPTDLLPGLHPVFVKGDFDSPPPGLASFLIQAFDGSREQRVPNMGKFRILRGREAGNGELKWKTINVFYDELAEAAVPGSDPELKWGDVVLFDLESDRRNGDWTDFEDETQRFMSQSSRIAFQLKLADLEFPVAIFPESDYSSFEVPGQYTLPFHDRPVSAITNLTRFTTHRDDLDLASVKVLRSEESGVKEFVFDCTSPSEDIGFFLQDGDTVSIPRKEGQQTVRLQDRNDHIWISRPGTPLYDRAIHRSSFEGREIDGLPIARAVAKHYSGYRPLPFPDFSKLTLRTPGGESEGVEMVSLKDKGKIAIPWGTIIEIPMQEGVDPADWTGLNDDERKLLTDLSRVIITVEPEGMDPKKMTTGFSFRNYKRVSTGELVSQSRGSQKEVPRPEFWDAFGEQFRGDDVKWDTKRLLLKNGTETITLSADGRVPPFIDGDILHLFKAL